MDAMRVLMKRLSLAQAVRIATIAVVLASSGAAPAATLDPERCAAQQPRVEEALQDDRGSCLALASRRERRGYDGRFQACEERAIARWNRRMRSVGCDLGGGSEETATGSTGEAATAWVELLGQTQQVSYRVIDGLAVLAGDILLGTEEEVRAGDERIRARRASGLQTAQSVSIADFNWSKNIIPYVISGNISTTVRNRINEAVTHWNANTIVRLKPRAGEADFVRFQLSPLGTISMSLLGQAPLVGEQPIFISSAASRGTVIHEIGHAVGLWHEQGHPDRDSSIYVDFLNIKLEYWPQYVVVPLADRSRGPFDFNSIMLYSAFGGIMASNPGIPVMTRNDGTTWTSNETALSTGDIIGVTRLAAKLDDLITLKHKFRNDSAQLCMETVGVSPGSAIEGRTCGGSTGQRWLRYNHPDTKRQLLISQKTGMCAEVPGGTNVVNTNLLQAPCAGVTRQAYSFTGKGLLGGSPFVIRNTQSGRCVSIEGPTTSTRNVEQESCTPLNSKLKWHQELF